MRLIQLLENHKSEIISSASASLTRASLKSYKNTGSTENEKRIQKLYDVVLESIKKNTLIKIIQYAKEIATQRITTGYEIYELHTAFNVLEEVLWQNIRQKLPQMDCVEVLRLVSTTLGAGKESLANTYVAFASKMKAPVINHSVLFEGTEGG